MLYKARFNTYLLQILSAYNNTLKKKEDYLKFYFLVRNILRENSSQGNNMA